MSSNIPTRRVTRTTRTTAVKENENANARPSRISTRSKPVAPIPTAGGVTRATAASRAKVANVDAKPDHAPVKRKREALGEVTTVNKPKPVALKGKEKENVKETFDGVVLNSKVITTRQPLRTVTGTRHTTQAAADAPRKPGTKLNVARTQVLDDVPMAVDPPAQVPIPSIAVRKSLVVAKKSIVSTSGRPEPLGRLSTRSNRQGQEDPEEVRVFKKRRTSSEAPEDVQANLSEEEVAARIAAEIEAFAEEPEADPEGSSWNDLDADDVEDPLMVSEYVVEIFHFLKKLELTTMPNPNYMESQKELAWKMRGILTDWLIQVHVRFRLLPETLFLCVNIMDRFLSARVVSLAKLQLVGVTCMFIAAKFEEIVSPSVTHFLLCADSSYTESEILQAERYILKTLDWNLSYPNPVHFLRRISKADDYNVKARTLGKYLLEIGCLEWRLIAAPPSLMAAAAIWLARIALGMEIWTPNLAHYSSYPESALIPTANLMLNYILKPIRHESFQKKYAGKRYFKSSVYMREWALDRWVENSQVDLAEELPRLKAEIKLEREDDERQVLEEEARVKDSICIDKPDQISVTATRTRR